MDYNGREPGDAFSSPDERQLTLQNATMRCQYRKTLNTHRQFISERKQNI